MEKRIVLDRKPTKKEQALLAFVAAATNLDELVVVVNGDELHIKASRKDAEGRELIHD